MIYKCSDLVNKKRVLNELDFIMEDNKIANSIYTPAILCYSDAISLKNFKDNTLLVKIKSTNHCNLYDTECEKLEDFLTGVGSLEYNQIYCSVLNGKNTLIESPAKKRRDWNWYSKNEDILEEVVDNLDTTYSYLLPAIYKKYTKEGINLLKINNHFLILQPTIVIQSIDNI